MNKPESLSMLAFYINNGARLLDKKQPSWYKNVDLSTLSIMAPSRCILAQVFGGYCRGLDFLYGHVATDSLVIEHGFNIRDFRQDSIAVLIWVDHINMRLDHDSSEEKGL